MGRHRFLTTLYGQVLRRAVASGDLVVLAVMLGDGCRDTLGPASFSWPAPRAGLPLHAFGELLATCLTIPLLERLRRDLAIHQQFSEFAPLCLTLERHLAIISDPGSRRIDVLNSNEPAQRDSISRRTPDGRLSSRTPTNRECRRSPSAVHSTNATSTTVIGLTHRRVAMSDSVMPSLQRLLPVLLGRLRNGHERAGLVAMRRNPD